MKICTECGREFGDDLTTCPDDGAKLEPVAVHPPAAIKRSTVLATTSLILGILSMVLCLGPVLGIPAVICGHIALSQSKRDPARFGGGKMSVAGLVTGYLSTMIAIVVLALVLVVWPKAKAAKQKFDETFCLIRIAQVSFALHNWSTNHNGRLPASLLELTNELSDPNVLICPDDPHRHASGSRAIQVWDPDNVSYQLMMPGAALSNVEKKVILRCPIHGLELLGDGSVQSASSNSESRILFRKLPALPNSTSNYSK